MLKSAGQGVAEKPAWHRRRRGSQMAALPSGITSADDLPGPVARRNCRQRRGSGIALGPFEADAGAGAIVCMIVSCALWDSVCDDDCIYRLWIVHSVFVGYTNGSGALGAWPMPVGSMGLRQAEAAPSSRGIMTPLLAIVRATCWH
jgi:hypothetical protein